MASDHLPSYSRWGSEMCQWGGGTLQARIEAFRPHWFRIDRWSCAALLANIPVIFYLYPRRAPRLDLIFSSSTWEPYSSRLRCFLRELPVDFEEFPCRLIDSKSGEVLSDDYAVVHFLGCRECFDWRASDYDTAVA